MGSVYLLRHGQASFGAADYDVLSPAGERQAETLGEELRRRAVPVRAVWSGTLRRQLATASAALAAAGVDVEVRHDARWNEYDHIGLVPEGQSVDPAGSARQFQTLLDTALRTWLSSGSEIAGTGTWETFSDGAFAALSDVFDGLPEWWVGAGVHVGRGDRGGVRAAAGCAAGGLPGAEPDDGEREHHEGRARPVRDDPAVVQRARALRGRSSRTAQLPVAPRVTCAPVQSLRTEDPARVGDYAVLGRLGQGAMGRVYLARSPGGRFVAVKVVRPELADDPGFRERFRHEVASMRAVGGFWTAAVVDADPDGLWLATEYVPGPTLFAAVAAHGPLPLPALRGLAAGLAEALRAIHGAGLVHRDLKPANVLLAADGPRVIDFGIAKALESTGLTATGMFFGTPGFLSPEQIEGRDATPASDVFALGAVLTYAATGAGPFGTGDTPALLYRAVHAPPALDDVPPVLRPLVARCLDRSPAGRPSPSELLAEAGTPEGPDWLPPAVRAMVTEQETELARPSPRPPTRAYTKAGPPLPFGGAAKPAAPAPSPAVPDFTPAGPPPAGPAAAPFAAAPPAPGSGNRAEFRVSRVSALVLAGLSTAGAFVCGAISQDSGRAGNGGAALLFLVAWLVLTASAVRFWWIVVRWRWSLEVSGSGLTVGRGRRTTSIGWGQLARVRVVEGKRPWLVVWTVDGSHVDLGGRYAGGYRAFPVGHERRRPGRQREVRELRAALGWYGRTVYDPSP